MFAIHTRYLPATDTRGARISATCRRFDQIHRATVSRWSVDADGVQLHAHAARELIARQMPFAAGLPLLCAGDTFDGRGFVFAVAPQEA